LHQARHQQAVCNVRKHGAMGRWKFLNP
jgi:hypothetical protein